MKIKFGPGGLGGVKQAIGNLESFARLGLKACEVEFTYGVYIKNKKDAVSIGKVAKKLGIELSIHAPYWINLNSKEKAKVEASKKRILKSCEIGHYLSCGKKVNIVFHCGYYGDSLSLEKKDSLEAKKLVLGKRTSQIRASKELAYDNIKLRIQEIMESVKQKKWDVVLCPEIIGKKNVFGSIEEIARLVDETGCGFCIDFAHVLARYGEHKFDLLKKSFKQKKWHCHFSGIEFGEKGEKRHLDTKPEHWKSLFKRLPRGKEIVIISESPRPVEDSGEGLKIFDKIKKT